MQFLITNSDLKRSVANMPMVRRKSQETIIADYELLQELHKKWRNSKTLAGIEPMDAMKYEIFDFHNGSSAGIVMWNGKHCALLSAKGRDKKPYAFIETVMGDMEKGDIVVLFSESDYEAAKRCNNIYYIEAKKLEVILEN